MTRTPSPHRSRRVTHALLPLLGVLLGAAVLLAACTAQPPAGSAQPDAAQPPASSAGVEAMAAEQKRSELPTGFPIEIPVPAGQVERGRQQGELAWDYLLLVDAPPDAVAQWYREAYAGRSWILVADDPVEGGVRLSFEKGAGAQSRITIVERDASGPSGGSRVTAEVGIGVNVEGVL